MYVFYPLLSLHDRCVTFGVTLVDYCGMLQVSSFLLFNLMDWNGSQKFNLRVTWQRISKLEFWSLLASRCVTVGVVGRRRVMHSVALTANAPLELPELKQQRCWLPVNDHRSSSPPDVNALFVSRIKDRNPATATVSLMSTPGRCRLNLVLASQTSPHLRKAFDAQAKTCSASSSSLDSSGPWNQPDHFGSR